MNNELVQKAMEAEHLVFSLGVTYGFNERQVIEFAVSSMYRQFRWYAVYKEKGRWHINAELPSGEMTIICIGKFRFVRDMLINYIIEWGLENDK